MLRRLPRIVVGLALVLAAGCGGEDSFTTDISAGDWIATAQTSRQPTPGSTTLLAAVQFDAASGCVYLNNGGVQIPVVWPADTTLDAARPALLMANGEVALNTVSVTLTGRFSMQVEVPSECPGTDEATTPFVADIVDVSV